ncbi:probable cytochrome P450 6a23 isoform X3 [Cardiocondyla obscurior]
MIYTLLLAVLIALLSIVYIYYKYVVFNIWRKKGVLCIENPVVPLGTLPIPIVTGKQHFGLFLQNLYVRYKQHRVIGLYLFMKPSLLISDPDIIRTVLTKNFDSFHNRGLTFNGKTNPLFYNLLTMSGSKWRKMRVKLTPAFTSGKIKRMFLILKECSDDLAKYLESKAQIRDSVEIKDIFTRYTTDVIMSSAFGIRSNCIENSNSEHQTQGKNILKIKIIWYVLFTVMPKIMDFFSISILDQRVSNFYLNMFEETVKYRKTHKLLRHDFMNILMQLMEKDHLDEDDNGKNNNITSTTDKLTMTEAAAQSFFFFLAGFETSSATATFALYELAHHEDVQDKLRNEIDEVLKTYGELSYDTVNEMKYLHKVVNETMRKYPPIPFLVRICTQEINLETTEIIVPKGTLIFMPIFGLHRDPSIYPDPEKFDPERFNADEIAIRHSYTFLPFGEGPRNCIGMRFGYIQTKVGLVNLLSKYKFKPHPQTPYPLSFNEKSLGLAAKGGVHLHIEPR